jgi:non-heme Fe2+,alpha-ketoglutarate-dependent halogenase
MTYLSSPTSSDVETFERQGFLGPLPAFMSSAAIDQIANNIYAMVRSRRDHPLYGRYSVRDWHLVSDEVLDLFTHPAIVDRLQSLAGPDLTLWRSKIFYKRPHDGPVGWHQEWGPFNGEEIGNDKPSLIPAKQDGSWWNLTVWIALSDVTTENGPMRFVRGSHRTRYPIEMVPMPDSEFWDDPFIGVSSVEEIVERASTSKLILDIDTSRLFDGVDTTQFDLPGVKTFVHKAMSDMKAARTVPFDESAADIVAMPMKKGEFVIFTERTMHGSLANYTDGERLAINGRVTMTDTQIYPFRYKGDYIDGSNINIREHRCILLSGRDRSGGFNQYRETPGAVVAAAS